MIRIVRVLALTALLASLAGCGKGEGGPGGGGGFQFPPTAVEVAPVSRGAVSETFETVGTVQAREAITVVSEIDGIVVSLPFREGDPIEMGALIAKIDDAELAADLARAEAQRDQRKSSYDRVQKVVEQRAGAPQDLDDAGAALKVAEADVAYARARLAKTRIVAPFSGMVGSREVSPGAYVRSGERITDLAQVSELEIVFGVPERYAGRLTRGATVRVSTTAYPGYALEGSIDVVDPTLDSATRNVRVIARVQNPESKFRPGMSANVTAVFSARASALTIPSEAVFAEGDQFLAYVVQPDSTVARAPLKIGTRLAQSVEIVEGLNEGDLVVRAGHQKLYPGAKVMAINSHAAPATADAAAEPGMDAEAAAREAAAQGVEGESAS
jgi:membrane fusion protein (multidrug efflux system)